MKQIVCLALALVLILSSVGFAEGFSLRNGITFDDSLEDVLAKETLEIEEVNDTVEESEEDDGSEKEYPYSIKTKKGTIAGISDSYIVYQFNSDRQLRNVAYYFRNSTYKDSIDNDYNSVNEGLRRKYGKPLGYTNGDCYIFTGQALESAVLIAYLYDALDKFGDLRDYDEWDVDAGGYHVKIEQVEYYYGLSYSEITYDHEMSYTYFTDEDLQAAKEEKSDRQEAGDNDL